MEKETQKLITLAEKRNKLIPNLIQTGEYHRPSKKLPQQIIRVLFHLMVENISADKNTLTNLDLSSDLARDNILLIACNHLSDADTPLKSNGLRLLGYKNLSENLIHPAGLKMIERPYINFFTRSEELLLIPTPFDYQKINQLLQDDSIKLPPSSQQTLKTCLENYQRLSRTALKTLKQQVKLGKIPSLYPESTRSRDGFIKQAPPLVGSYFTSFGEQAYILPMQVNGGEKIIPPEQLFIPSLARSQVEIIAGKPIKSLLLKQLSKELNLEITDLVMALIGGLKIEKVAPFLREKYALIYDHSTQVN